MGDTQIRKFSVGFLILFVTVIDKVVGFKSIAAYRSGLEINTNVTWKEAEEGLFDALCGEYYLNIS